jgi:hypothetical protein
MAEQVIVYEGLHDFAAIGHNGEVLLLARDGDDIGAALLTIPAASVKALATLLTAAAREAVKHEAAGVRVIRQRAPKGSKSGKNAK